MNALQISTAQQIKDLQAQLKALKAEQPKKATPLHTIEKREFNDVVMSELLSFSKTSKVVNKYLKTMDLTTFKALLSEKQLESFDSVRFTALKKSPSLVCKCFTPKQYESFKVNGNKCTPTQYLNTIIKGSTMSTKSYDKCRLAKVHYSIAK